jgi:hypothetical protein
MAWLMLKRRETMQYIPNRAGYGNACTLVARIALHRCENDGEIVIVLANRTGIRGCYILWY